MDASDLIRKKLQTVVATAAVDASNQVKSSLYTNPPVNINFTGTIDNVTATTTSSSISGYTLTLGSTVTGTFYIGMVITGSGITAGTRITGLAPATGTYYINISQTIAGPISITGTIGMLTVTSTPSGILAVGQLITGANVAEGTTITALATGTGDLGTYTVSLNQTVSFRALIATYTPQNNITYIQSIKFASQEDKMNFDAGMRYVYYDAAGIPYVSSMNFSAQRLPKQ
jgi:hypothetical protein